MYQPFRPDLQRRVGDDHHRLTSAKFVGPTPQPTVGGPVGPTPLLAVDGFTDSTSPSAPGGSIDSTPLLGVG